MVYIIKFNGPCQGILSSSAWSRVLCSGWRCREGTVYHLYKWPTDRNRSPKWTGHAPRDFLTSSSFFSSSCFVARACDMWKKALGTPNTARMLMYIVSMPLWCWCLWFPQALMLPLPNSKRISGPYLGALRREGTIVGPWLHPFRAILEWATQASWFQSRSMTWLGRAQWGWQIHINETHSDLKHNITKKTKATTCKCPTYRCTCSWSRPCLDIEVLVCRQLLLCKHRHGWLLLQAFEQSHCQARDKSSNIQQTKCKHINTMINPAQFS